MKKSKDLKFITIKDIKPKWYKRRWNFEYHYGGKGAIYGIQSSANDGRFI